LFYWFWVCSHAFTVLRAFAARSLRALWLVHGWLPPGLHISLVSHLPVTFLCGCSHFTTRTVAFIVACFASVWLDLVARLPHGYILRSYIALSPVPHTTCWSGLYLFSHAALTICRVTWTDGRYAFTPRYHNTVVPVARVWSFVPPARSLLRSVPQFSCVPLSFHPAPCTDRSFTFCLHTVGYRDLPVHHTRTLVHARYLRASIVAPLHVWIGSLAYITHNRTRTVCTGFRWARTRLPTRFQRGCPHAFAHTYVGCHSLDALCSHTVATHPLTLLLLTTV